MTRFKEKTAIVTGGGKGIGQAIARRFAREGASVAIWEQDEEAGLATAGEIGREGGSSIHLTCDVTSSDGVAQALEATQEELGAPSILVNNAGIAHVGTATCANLYGPAGVAETACSMRLLVLQCPSPHPFVIALTNKW